MARVGEFGTLSGSRRRPGVVFGTSGELRGSVLGNRFGDLVWGFVSLVLWVSGLDTDLVDLLRSGRLVRTQCSDATVTGGCFELVVGESVSPPSPVFLFQYISSTCQLFGYRLVIVFR